MGVIATLSEKVTEVEPGDSATCTVKLYNDGTVVDTFLLDVLGDAKEWASVFPDEVSVFPGEVTTVEIVFEPPREAGVKHGKVGYALRAMSQEDTEHSATVEGAVDITGYHEVGAELIARTLRGSRSARGRLAVDNLGNAPVTLRLTGADEDGKLRFHFSRPSVTVDGGTTRVVPYRLRPRSRFLRGEDRTHLYRIQLSGSGVQEEAAGSMVQSAMLPPWAPRALMLAAGATAVALVLVPTYLAPKATSQLFGKTVSDSADTKTGPTPGATGNADGEKKGEQEKKDGGASPSGSPTGGATKGAQNGSGGAGGSQQDNGSAVKAPAPVLGDVSSTSFRLEANAKPAKAGSFALKEHTPVPQGQTLTISDLHIENIANDSGTAQLRRDGEVIRTFDLKDPKKEWHWVEPVTFTEGQKVTLAVNCTNGNNKNCTPAFAFSGRTYTVAQ
ncbi:hypothetical protein [Streptomyces sp. NPDC059918]|uniref:COG1470 family protein n=1 Tax=unclassified Streptomyces TaxID=2593676 RepID=UPI0036642473